MKNPLCFLIPLFFFVHLTFAQSSPDNISPIPNNYGDKNYEGVNLFNGSVNLQYDLMTIKGQNLSYTLSAFYNSRSSAMFIKNKNSLQVNSLNGFGWKLMDYYKIVLDGTSRKYYLLDGHEQVQLNKKNQTGNNYIYYASGKYYLWQISIATDLNSAVAVSDDGTKYYMSNIHNVGGNSYYNLSKIVDASDTDTLYFGYDGNMIASIANKYGDQVTFTYNYQILSQINYYSKVTGISSSVRTSETKFGYTNYVYQQLNYSILSSIKFYADADIRDNISLVVESNPGWTFTYYNSGYPLSLDKVTSPLGKKTTYGYRNLTNQPFSNYTAASSIKEEFLTNTKVTTIEYSNSNSHLSADGIYAYFNEATVYPGTDINYSGLNGYYTSFEESDLKNDPLIDDDDGIKTSTDHAHSGSRSIKFYFKNYVFFVTDRTLESKKLLLNSGDGTPPDSITLSYYWYGDYPDGEICGYNINAKLKFYDKNGNTLNSKTNEIMYHCSDYGEQWNYYSFTVPVPPKSIKASFSITGGGDNGIFYVDDLRMTGTISSTNGKIVTKFLNGTNRDSLKDLPASYYGDRTNSIMLLDYFTGFESGKKESWLKFGDHATPQFVDNGYNNVVSFEGDYALRLKSTDSGKQSLIYFKNPVIAPPNTSNFVFSFQYTKPEISSNAMSLSVKVTLGGVQQPVITIPLSGSYDLDKRYYSFMRSYNITSGQSVQCSLYVSTGPENYALVDNLSYQFVNLTNSTAFNNNLQDSIFTGSSYSTRVFKKTDSEIGSTYSYYTSQVSPLNPANKYIQFNASTVVKRGGARNTKQVMFNSYGLASSVQQLKLVRKLYDKTKFDTTWVKTNYVYAYEQYPSFDVTGSNRLTNAVSSSEFVSTDFGNSWEINSATYSQWGKWNSAGTLDNTNGTKWQQWRSYVLKQPISTTQLQTDLNNFKNNLNFSPSSSNWICSNTTSKINPATNDVISFYDPDTVRSNYIYSKGSSTSQGSSHPVYQQTVPIAGFENDEEQPSVYMGFENYEAARSTAFSTSQNSSYAHTGLYSQVEEFSTVYHCNNGSAAKKYIISAWLMSITTGTTASITYKINNGNQVNIPTTEVSTGKWEYFEYILNVPAHTDSITLTITGKKNQATTTDFLIDDVRIGSADAVFSSTVYDIDRMLVTETIDNNTNVSRFVYDPFGEQVALIGNDNVPKSLSISQFKRSEDPNDSIKAALNSTMSIMIQDTGKYYSFNEPANIDWVFSGASVDYPNRRINFTPRSEATLNYRDGQNLNNSGIFFTANLAGFQQISKTLNNSNLILYAGSYKFAVQLRQSSGVYIADYYMYLDNTHNYVYSDTISNSTTTIQQWAILINQSNITWLIDGKVIYSKSNYTSASNGSWIFTTGYPSANNIWVKDIIVFTDPLIENKHLDGEGKVIQSQTALQSSVITTEAVYDSMNRLSLQSLPADITGGTLLYNDGFITSHSVKTGKLEGTVQQGVNDIDQANPDDQYYLYSQTVYETSPETKVVEEYRPGTYYSMMGQSYEQGKENNFRKAVNWVYLHRDQIEQAITYIGYAADLVNVVVEPEDPLAWVFVAMDFEEIVQDALVAPKDPSSGYVPPVTSYFYDKKGQLVKITLPLANSGQDTSQVITYSYDFPGNKITENTPEGGLVKYVYDDAGRLRYTQAAGKGDTTLYYRYNKLGDETEKGYFIFHWTDDTRPTLQSNANNQSYPSSGCTVLGTSQYGDNNYTPENRGRLYKAVYTNRNTNNIIEETYNYSKPGNITSLLTKFSSLADTFKVLYGYNNLGEINSIIYPEETGNWNVKYFYNKQGLIGKIGNNTSETAYATYNYHADGSIKTENLEKTSGELAGTYKFNAPGYLTQVKYNGFMQYDFNYNFAGWFDNLRNDPVYGGYIASSEYTPSYPGHKDQTKTSYKYDQYENLSYYKRSPIGDDHYNELSIQYDLNQNLSSLNQLPQTPSVSYNYFNNYYANSITNRPDRQRDSIVFQKDSKSSYYYFREDTTYINYYNDGQVKTLRDYSKYNHNDNGFFPATDSIKYGTKYFFYNTEGLPYFVSFADTTLIGTTQSTLLNKNTIDYNIDGIRKQKTSEHYSNGSYTGKTIKRYIHGISSLPIFEYIENYSSSNSLTSNKINYYLYGPEGMIGMNTKTLPNGSTDSYIILKDNLGSTYQVVNRSSGSVASAIYYDVFGNTDNSQSYNPSFLSYKYTGQEYDDETGLYNYIARFYDPAYKYFLSPDPLMVDPAQPYTYAGNNPANFSDPTGGAPLTRSKTAAKLVNKGIDAATTIAKAPKMTKRTTATTRKLTLGRGSVASRTVKNIKIVDKRMAYLGATPGKGSKTGREVLETTFGRDATGIVTGTATPDKLPRAKWLGTGGQEDFNDLAKWHIFTEVPVKPDEKFTLGVSKTTWDWVPLDEKIHMGHKIDAVTAWNGGPYNLRQYGAKAKEVRKFMLNSKIYEFEYGKINSARGASLGRRYLPPLK